MHDKHTVWYCHFIIKVKRSPQVSHMTEMAWLARIPSYILLLSFLPLNSLPNNPFSSSFIHRPLPSHPFSFFFHLADLSLRLNHLACWTGWMFSDGEWEGVWGDLKGKISVPVSPLLSWRSVIQWIWQCSLSAGGHNSAPLSRPSSCLTLPSFLSLFPSLLCCTRTAPYLIFAVIDISICRFYISSLPLPWKRSQGLRLAS